MQNDLIESYVKLIAALNAESWILIVITVQWWINKSWHIEAEIKCPSFSRRYFQMPIFERKYFNFYKNVTEVYYQGSN